MYACSCWRRFARARYMMRLPHVLGSVSAIPEHYQPVQVRRLHSGRAHVVLLIHQPAFALPVMNASAFVMAALSLFWSSQKQDIESDPAKWAVFAFPREEFELTLRVPDKYIPVELQGSPLRPVVPDSRVTMLIAQYDYGRPDSGDISQMTVRVALTRDHAPDFR